MNNSEYARTPLEPEIPESNNSQDSATSRDKIVWLAGLLDGEGYVGINIWKESKSSPNARIKFRPSIQMSHTNYLVYKKTYQVLRELGIRHYIRLYKQDESRKPRIELMVVNRKNVRILSEAIRPYVTRLAEYIDIVLQFIDECEQTDHYHDKDLRYELALKYDAVLKRLREQSLPPETTKEHLLEMVA